MSEATSTEDLEPFLQPATYVDSDHPSVINFVQRVTGNSGATLEKCVRIYYAVRDEFRYDPYSVEMTEFGMKGSTVLERGNGFCITKSTLMAAACRVIGIPARLGFADVRNHLASERMIELMGTDLFVYHGFVEVFLDDIWVKATPVFNLSLCEKFGTLPLEFDGRNDSIFHPYDATGNKHMEYITEHGSFADIPLADIKASFEMHYPKMYGDEHQGQLIGDMEAEAVTDTMARRSDI